MIKSLNDEIVKLTLSFILLRIFFRINNTIKKLTIIFDKIEIFILIFA